MSAEETNAEKIARLRGEKTKREKALADLKEAAVLEGLELEAKYERELGRQGVDFAMVDATEYGEGYVVVKLGTDLSFRKYIDCVHTAEGDVDAADLFSFVSPSVVHPAPEVYTDIVRRRGFIANRSADALASLHGVRKKKIEGKF